MTDWSFQLVDAPHVASGGVRGALSTARSRVVTLSKDASSTCTWMMDYYQPGTVTRSADVQLIVPRSTDVVAWRGSVIKFRGRLTTWDVQFADTGDIEVLCGATSYKDMLDHRFLLDADCLQLTNSDGTPGAWQRNYAATVDMASIVWDLINLTQSKPHGTLGILPNTVNYGGAAPTTLTKTATTIPSTGNSGYAYSGGNGSTGHTPGHMVEFPITQSIKACIDSLAAGNGGTTDFGSGPIDTSGFEWDIIPDQLTGQLRLQMWPKNNSNGGRGVNTGYVLDYGGAVASGDAATAELDNFANFVRVSVGSQFVQRTIGAGTAADGLWEQVVTLQLPQPHSGNPTGMSTTQMEGAAASAFFFAANVIPSYTLNMRPLAWQETDGPALGDTVQVEVPSLEGTTRDPQRVIGQTFTIGEDGDETVGITVGLPPLFGNAAQAARIRASNARYRKLERALYGGTN